jgi:DNA-binding NarL/FixJ family response regulator
MPARRRRTSVHVTTKEVEVLDLLAQGFKNADIAETLGLAERTVKAHIDRCASKLGVKGEKTGCRILLARYWSCPLFRLGAGRK